MSALVMLRESAHMPVSFQYGIGSGRYFPMLWVCLTCETVVASVKDNPVCPTCDLRDLFERTIENLREELHIDY